MDTKWLWDKGYKKADSFRKDIDSKKGLKMSIKYYFYRVGNVRGSLRRVDLDADPIILDAWINGEWMLTPTMASIIGAGGDGLCQYEKVTKAEAEAYMKANPAK